MKTKLIIFSIAALCFSAAPVLADIYPTVGPGGVTFGPGTAGEDSLQTVLNKITVAPSPTPGTSQVTTTDDALVDDWDSLWQPTAGGGAFATMIVEITAGASTQKFGIYDASNHATTLEIFSGSDGTDGSNTVGDASGKAILTFYADGKIKVAWDDGIPGPVTSAPFVLDAFGKPTFGFYLDTSNTWYSDTIRNIDDKDHMLAYQGKATNQDTISIPPFSPGLWTDNHFVIAWEDATNLGDGDYQDLVILLESVNPVPVPGAVLLGILGLSAAGIKLRRFA